jgi:hypothetical protein
LVGLGSNMGQKGEKENCKEQKKNEARPEELNE